MDGLAELHAHLRAVVLARMQSDPAHDIAHLDRVWRNAKLIADKDANSRVLLAASYLHDLINLPKDHADRRTASRSSADAAIPILRDLSFPQAEIDSVHHAIVAHSFSAGIPPETTEACIIRDADRLDALGAVGIARVFAVSGTLDRRLYDSIDPFAAKRELDDSAFALDHWRTKLLKLPRDMMTEGGRRIARERVTFMLGFLDQLSAEIGTNLPDTWRNG